MQRTTSLREAVTGTGRSQRAARRRHTDQRVVRRLDPLEVRHVAATIRVVLSGEATESGADLLGSRALLEAEHEVRVVRGADLGELPRVSELVVVEEATVDHVPRHRHMEMLRRASAVMVESFKGVIAD